MWQLAPVFYTSALCVCHQTVILLVFHCCFSKAICLWGTLNAQSVQKPLNSVHKMHEMCIFPSWIIVSTQNVLLLNPIFQPAWPWRWPLRPCASASLWCRCARPSQTQTGSRSRTPPIPTANSSTAWPSRCTRTRTARTQVWCDTSGFSYKHSPDVIYNCIKCIAPCYLKEPILC